jgi:NAD(P)-dependent dehydrogenase (short-subunit alcohol dehydrogenase family)
MFDPGFIGENVEMDIKGSALVTGASRGIGRAVAIALADRGFDTVATMRNPADGSQLAEETSGQLEVRRLDVTDPVTFEIPGDLQVLVNNAGIDTDYLPVEHSDLDDWRSIFETNVVGVVAMTKAAIPALRASRPSVICNITSSSIIASVPFYAAYRASKAAVSAFDDSLRVEVAGFGIRVVEILPGPIDTDMFQLSAGELPAARFDRYRAMAEVSTRQRTEYADPHVSDPAVAASLIVDAILDDGGPMRYGCDPLSVGMLDLWRQADDEAIYALTGKPILDEVTRLGRSRGT